MNSILRLILLAIGCFAVTVLLVIVLNTIVTATADCYHTGDCSRTPILGTIAYCFDALKIFCYFAVFPAGMLFGRRDFRKVFKNRMVRRAARIAFALIPLFLLPLKYFFTISFFQ
ncbi:MAG TPA: hypothetical protein PLP21_14545 [Pyrinomonadaceae bacterium]|nr:hypothetical protein [Acidobacteriota bacterium]HQZ97538.1 hypothetical protein [Pyrinomonadaceae bacterium]